MSHHFPSIRLNLSDWKYILRNSSALPFRPNWGEKSIGFCIINFYGQKTEIKEQQTSTLSFLFLGGLFNLAVRLMELFSPKQSEATTDFVSLTSLLGLYFQIRDDYANLCLDEYTANKSFAEDLTEGKFSFPIIHAIRYVLLPFPNRGRNRFPGFGEEFPT